MNQNGLLSREYLGVAVLEGSRPEATLVTEGVVSPAEWETGHITVIAVGGGIVKVDSQELLNHEIQELVLSSLGFSILESAELTSVSEDVVEARRTAMLGRLGVPNVIRATSHAFDTGIYRVAHSIPTFALSALQLRTLHYMSHTGWQALTARYVNRSTATVAHYLHQSGLAMPGFNKNTPNKIFGAYLSGQLPLSELFAQE